MRNALLSALGLFAVTAFAGSTPTMAPPLEELALASFPAVSVEQLVEGAQPKTSAIPHVSPERFYNLIVEPTTGPVSVDFAVLSNVAVGTPCRDSSAFTAQNAAIGDSCLASTTYGLNDGGTALLSTSTLSCYVSAANAITFRLCFIATDAGTFDPGAGLFVGKAIH